MNELIERLAREAGATVQTRCYGHGEYHDELTANAMVLRRFAALVAEECAMVADDTDAGYGAGNCEAAGCAIRAKFKEPAAPRERHTAPWTDFAGNPIHEGDRIQHPSGEAGVVVFLPSEANPGDAWRVDYDGGKRSRLCLQVGDKGRAVVIKGST